MELSPWQINSHSGSEKIPHLLTNPKVHYSVHKSPALDRIMSQMILVHILISHSFKIDFNMTHLYQNPSNGLFPSGY